MSSTTDANKVVVPEELLALIKEYKNVSLKIAKERFVQYLEEYSLEDEGFLAFCQRLVRKGIFKKSFLTALEEAGFIELTDEVDTSEDDTTDVDDVDDTGETDEVSDEDEDEVSSEGEDQVEVSEDEDTVVTEEGDETDEVVEEEEVSVDDVVRLADILGLTGDHKYRAEYEDVSHAVLTAKVLEAAGFTVTLDERLGGDIERRRGGKFVMDIHVSNKKACKVRVSEANPEGLGPVILFTNLVIAHFERQRDKMIDILVEGVKAQVEALA